MKNKNLILLSVLSFVLLLSIININAITVNPGAVLYNSNLNITAMTSDSYTADFINLTDTSIDFYNFTCLANNPTFNSFVSLTSPNSVVNLCNSGGGSNGGGGGGNGNNNNTNLTCNSLWVCSSWSTCNNNFKSRTCSDLYSCGNQAPPLLTDCSTQNSNSISGCVDLTALDIIINKWKHNIYTLEVLDEGIHKWKFGVC